jgi:rhodanese-related sulfurtransferase
VSAPSDASGRLAGVNPFDVPTITLDELPADAILLDVREAHEWAAGHVAGARHIPMNSVPATLTHEPGELGDGNRIFVICAMGGRSAQVTGWLVRQGYDATNVAGGMHAWEDSGRPMTSETGQPPTVL